MRITDMSVLHRIFSSCQSILNEPLEYLLVNTDNASWEENLLSQTTEKQAEQLFAIALIVQHKNDEKRIDSLFFICRTKHLTDAYINQIKNYIHPKEENSKGILTFLGDEWRQDPTRYPLTFWWTTRLDGDFTLIADRAIAPAFQGKGIMKSVSFVLIELLSELYGEDHKMQSICIHPATYLFYNPDDKECKGYHEGSLEDASCGLLKRIHNLPSAKPRIYFEISPEAVPALVKLGILSDKNNANVIAPSFPPEYKRPSLSINIEEVD